MFPYDYQYSSLFMSMSNLISINVYNMDIKRHMLICVFIFMLVGKERGEIVIRIRHSYLERSEVAIKIRGSY
jgi:hypothetical protein